MLSSANHVSAHRSASQKVISRLDSFLKNAAARFPLSAFSLTASLGRDSPQEIRKVTDGARLHLTARGLSRRSQRVANSIQRTAGGSVVSLRPRRSRWQTVTVIVHNLQYYRPSNLTGT